MQCVSGVCVFERGNRVNSLVEEFAGPGLLFTGNPVDGKTDTHTKEKRMQ